VPASSTGASAGSTVTSNVSVTSSVAATVTRATTAAAARLVITPAATSTSGWSVVSRTPAGTAVPERRTGGSTTRAPGAVLEWVNP
jgi:hypothetical protein